MTDPSQERVVTSVVRWGGVCEPELAYGWRTWVPQESTRTRATAECERQTQHRAGRAAAFEAVRSLHPDWVGPWRIDSDGDGCPIWPGGVVGSISHTRGIAVAVIGDHGNVRSIGADIERIRASNTALSGRVLDARDRDDLPVEMPDHVVASVYFCVREAIFKCLYPVTKVHHDWLSFRIGLDSRSRTFEGVVPLPDGTEQTIRGRLTIGRTLVASRCWWT